MENLTLVKSRKSKYSLNHVNRQLSVLLLHAALNSLPAILGVSHRVQSVYFIPRLSRKQMNKMVIYKCIGVAEATFF